MALAEGTGFPSGLSSPRLPKVGSRGSAPVWFHEGSLCQEGRVDPRGRYTLTFQPLVRGGLTVWSGQPRASPGATGDHRMRRSPHRALGQEEHRGSSLRTQVWEVGRAVVSATASRRFWGRSCEGCHVAVFQAAGCLGTRRSRRGVLRLPRARAWAAATQGPSTRGLAGPNGAGLCVERTPGFQDSTQNSLLTVFYVGDTLTG